MFKMFAMFTQQWIQPNAWTDKNNSMYPWEKISCSCYGRSRTEKDVYNIATDRCNVHKIVGLPDLRGLTFVTKDMFRKKICAKHLYDCVVPRVGRHLEQTEHSRFELFCSMKSKIWLWRIYISLFRPGDVAFGKELCFHKKISDIIPSMPSPA